LKAALLELKSIIQTPIKRFQPSSSDGADNREVIEEDNIPAIYTKVMGKGCVLLVNDFFVVWVTRISVELCTGPGVCIAALAGQMHITRSGQGPQLHVSSSAG